MFAAYSAGAVWEGVGLKGASGSVALLHDVLEGRKALKRLQVDSPTAGTLRFDQI